MKTGGSIDERNQVFKRYGISKDGKPKHVPNKVESRELRKLMSQTGLDEDELRVHKKYRKALADASKKATEKKGKDRLLKKITEKLKLAKEHPKVIFVYNSVKNRKSIFNQDYEIRCFLESDEFKNFLNNWENKNEAFHKK